MAGLRTVFNDDLGLPLIGGQVFTYDAGTSTPRDSYSDALFTTPNTNPIILDDAGSCELYLKGVYRLRVLDVNGVLIDEQDNVSQADGQFDSVLANTIAIGELQTSVANIEARNVLKTDENNKVMGYGLVASATVYSSLRSDLWRVAMPTVADMGELIFTTYDTEQVINGATIAAGAYFNPDLIAKESITGDKIARGATLNKPVIVDANYSASYTQTTTNNPNTVIMPNGEMKICNDPLSAASRKVGTATKNLAEYDASGSLVNTKSVGDKQTWQDMLTSRAIDMSYTNATGRPIVVSVALRNTSSASLSLGIRAIVNGVTVADQSIYAAGVGFNCNASFIVPAGSIYQISKYGSHSASVAHWSELR